MFLSSLLFRSGKEAACRKRVQCLWWRTLRQEKLCSSLLMKHPETTLRNHQRTRMTDYWFIWLHSLKHLEKPGCLINLCCCWRCILRIHTDTVDIDIADLQLECYHIFISLSHGCLLLDPTETAIGIFRNIRCNIWNMLLYCVNNKKLWSFGVK